MKKVDMQNHRTTNMYKKCLKRKRKEKSTPRKKYKPSSKPLPPAFIHSLKNESTPKMYFTGLNGLFGKRDVFISPEKISFSHGKIVEVQSGLVSAFVLNQNGDLYGRGINENGELGLGDTNPRSEWTFVRSQVKHVSLLGSHTLIIDTKDQVWGCGINWNNEVCPASPSNPILNPQLHFVSIPFHKRVKKVVAAYYRFSFVLCEDNHLFGFGCNRQGQLAPIKDIKTCIQSSIVLLEDGKLYFMGSIDRGLEIGRETKFDFPVQIPTTQLLPHESIQSIHYYYNNPLIKTTSAIYKVYYTNFHLNQECNWDFINDQKTLPKDLKIKKIQNGHSVSYLLTKDGILYVIGNATQCELGSNVVRHLPEWTPILSHVHDLHAFSHHYCIIVNPSHFPCCSQLGFKDTSFIYKHESSFTEIVY